MNWINRSRNLIDAIGRRVVNAIGQARGAGERPTLEDSLDDVARRSVLERYRADYESRARVLAEQLASGEIPVRQWLANMTTEVRLLHTFATAAAAGGFGNLTPEDLERIERITAEQLVYLRNWASQLQRMETFNADHIALRANMYGGAANQSFAEAQIAAAGLPALPFHPAQGTECRTNCGCRWRWEHKGEGSWDVYWVRHKNDSCPTCIAREKACNPLRIRNGQVQAPSGSALWAAKSLHLPQWSGNG